MAQEVLFSRFLIASETEPPELRVPEAQGEASGARNLEISAGLETLGVEPLVGKGPARRLAARSKMEIRGR